jgi:hypothetical protein
MDALEAAVALDPGNFWAQLKYSELHYRLRALNKAEDENAGRPRPGDRYVAAVDLSATSSSRRFAR